MDETRLWPLYLGNIRLPDKGVTVTYGVDIGKPWCGPVMAWYIEHPEIKILVDTGLNPEGPQYWPVESLGKFPGRSHPQDHIILRLQEIGVKPDDIDVVILTHLHTDHAGGIKFFKHAKFIVQKDEIRYAYFPDPIAGQAYIRCEFDLPLDYFAISQDFELIKGLKLIRTPGHSPGHQSVVLTLKKNGTVILTGDAIYSRESLGPPIIQQGFGSLNHPLALESILFLQHLADLEHGRLFFSHGSNIAGETLDGTSQWETELKDKSPFL